MTTVQAYCEQLDLPAAKRSRLQLQLCALELAQERGLEAVSLQDVLSRAQLGPSVFYADFDTLDSLWSSLAQQLQAEVFAGVSPLAHASMDPWSRMAICLRLHVHLAAKYPFWGSFLGQLQKRQEVQNPSLACFLRQELRQAFALQGLAAQHQGQLERVEASLQLALETMGNAVVSLHQGPAERQFAEYLVQMVLECLGLQPDKAKSLAFRRIPKPATVGGMLFSYLSQPKPADASADSPDPSAAEPVRAAEPPTLWNRHSVSPKRLQAPAPTRAELDTLLAAAMHAPDHGRLLPWRVIEFLPQDRAQLAQLFEEEKLRRDPLASQQDRERAREHATRPPMLLAFVVSPRAQTTVPSSEQWLSAGAALGNLLNAAHSLGFGAMVLSGDRCADNTLRSSLGLSADEHLAGFISLGSIREARPAHPERPTALVLSSWLDSRESSRTP